MITRTVKSNVASVRVFDTRINDTGNIPVILPANIKPTDAKAVEKYVRLNPPVDCAVICVNDVYTEEAIFGMTVDDFMKYAKQLTADRKFEEE